MGRRPGQRTIHPAVQFRFVRIGIGARSGKAPGGDCKKIGHKIIHSQEIFTKGNGDLESYWNGVAPHKAHAKSFLLAATTLQR